MARSRDPLPLSPHWHFDLRLEAELPEDNVVRTRFVVGAGFGTLAVVSILLLAWIGYTRTNLRAEVAEFDRIAMEGRDNIREVELMQKEFEGEATKVENAARIVKGRLLYSDFVGAVARTLPATMALDQIALAEDGLKISGQVSSASEVGRYVSALRQDPAFSASFAEIKQSGFAPSRAGNTFVFDITFKLKPAP